MTTALVGDFLIGVQPLWPNGAISVADWFDRPTWERPTGDNGGDGEIDTPDDFSGEGGPGFSGGEDDEYTGGNSGGSFDGGSFEGHWWVDYGDGSGGTLNVVLSDGSVISIEVAASRRNFYRIEVYDADGDRVSQVPEWLSGKLRRTLDQASILEFTVAADAEGVADLVRPNVVWLRDRWGFVVDVFQIQRRKPRGTGDASYMDIVCQGKITQLAGEVVLTYDGADLPVLDHVTALLDLQIKDGAVTLGKIDADIADIALPFFQGDTNIHAALLQLQLALPKEQRGRIYVDPKNRLQWRLVPGDVTEQVITRALNVRSIEAETDYDSIVNRLYMYGEGQDRADRLRLTEAGEAEDYIDDADSITAYGLHPFIKVDRRIRYPETLLRVANRILEEFSDPPTTVRVELLDVAKADNAPVGWQDIHIGGKYRVVDTALGLDSSIEIVSIETDLARPVPIRVDLANQTRNLSDFISDLVDALEQPLDVDGDRYPTMGRNYSERDPRTDYERAGDVRWNNGDDRGEMHDGTDWRELAGAGGIPLYRADSVGELPSGVEAYALGFIEAGDEEGAWYERNAANNAWQGRTIWHTEA